MTDHTTAPETEDEISLLDLLQTIVDNHKIDAIIHFAGSIVVPESVSDLLKYYANNTATSRNLIEAVANGKRAARSIHEYLAGDYSIADIATWPWVRTHKWSGVEIDDMPHLQRWLAAIRARCWRASPTLAVRKPSPSPSAR